MSEARQAIVSDGSRSEVPVSTTVAFELASALDCEPTELSPLSESIDPEALDRLVDADRTGELTVAFRHEGRRIAVTPEEIEIASEGPENDPRERDIAR